MPKAGTEFHESAIPTPRPTSPSRPTAASVILQAKIDAIYYDKGELDEVMLHAVAAERPLNTVSVTYTGQVSSITPTELTYGSQPVVISGFAYTTASFRCFGKLAGHKPTPHGFIMKTSISLISASSTLLWTMRSHFWFELPAWVTQNGKKM